MAERYEVRNDREVWDDHTSMLLALCRFEEDARLIAHRLNTHDGLVAALKLADDLINRAAPWLDTRVYDSEERAAMRAEVDTIAAALSAAESEQGDATN